MTDGDDDDDGYDAMFEAWARGRAEIAHDRKPYIRRWRYEDYDGCTWFFDFSSRACLQHDIDLWFAETPEEVRLAHLRFRRRIRGMAGGEELPFRWFWVGLAWVMWCGVMVGAGRIWRYRQLAWARAD